MSPDAVLFDIDGTLVDSNYVHVQAWSEAFDRVGHPVPAWRIHRAIGMDSSQLLSELLGKDAPDDVVERAQQAHTEIYGRLTPDLELLPGARELVAAVAGRGMQAVLATSAPEHELATLRGLLEVEDEIAVVTSGADVGTAKPEPDLVRVALERAGVEAGRAVFLGDSRWDVIAAARAGVPAVGVLTGGISAAELRDAGAVAVYRDAADLLAQLEDSPLTA